MAVSPQRARKVSHRQIMRLGGRRGALFRAGTKLTDICVNVIDQSTQDRRGELIDPTAKIALVSTFKPDGSEMSEVPNKETDEVALYGLDGISLTDRYRIINKPTAFDVAGVVSYWEFAVIV
jgi:hypothetical protein